LKAFIRCLVLLLAVRGALGKGFGMGDIGKAIKAVSQDPPKMPDAIQQSIQQATENTQKLVGDANEALAGADASRAVDAAKNAAQSASGALPAVSVAVDGSRAGAGFTQSTTPSPVEVTAGPWRDESATGSQAVQDAFGHMFSDRGAKDTADRASPGSVAEAIAKLKEGRIEDVASQVSKRGQEFADAVQDASVRDIVKAAGGPATPGSAVSQAMSQAKRALDSKKAEVGSLAEKAKTATVKDTMGLADTDDAKKGAAIVKGSTWQDLSDAVGRVDVKDAVANPARTVQNIGKKQFLSPTEGAKDEQDGAGVGGEGSMVDARVVAIAVLAGFILGAYVVFRRLTKPRQVGAAMLSGDPEQDSVAAARHWMGASARDVVPHSPGGNSEGFSRF